MLLDSTNPITCFLEALCLEVPFYQHTQSNTFLSLLPSLGKSDLTATWEGGLFLKQWAFVSRHDLWFGPAGAVWMKLWAVPPPSMFLLFKTKRKLRRGKTIRMEMCLVVSVSGFHLSPNIMNILAGVYGSLNLSQNIEENVCWNKLRR